MTAPRKQPGRARRRHPAPLPAATLVHDRTFEQRDQRRRHVDRGFYVVQVHRAVCTCGWASTWNEDRAKSIRLADRHNRSGQLAVDWDAVDAQA